jgi:glycosyltransferase involved in cell wall biosynthesis
LYLSIGESCAQLTVQSISFLRQAGYDGPIRVVTDTILPDAGELGFETVEVPAVEGAWESRYYKTQLNRFAFPRNLYLDADTLPIAPIDSLWDELRWGDLCLAHDIQADVGSFLSVSWGKEHLSRDELIYMGAFPLQDYHYFNSGVMLWRQCPAVERLFRAWHREWKRFRNLDQLALVRAFAEAGTPVHTLSPVWNCPGGKFRSIGASQRSGVRILHFLSRQRSLLSRYIEEYSLPASASSLHQGRVDVPNTGEIAQDRRRVLWITSTSFPKIGGIELFIEKTIGGLSDLCEVAVVTRDGQWYPGQKPVIHFPLKRPKAVNESEAWRLMAHSLQNVIARFAPHVVHFGSAHSASCRALIPPGIATFATVHGNDLTNLRPARREDDPTAYIVESLNECDYIFAVSSHTASLVRSWGVTAPTGVYTPGCDIDFYRPSPPLGQAARRHLRLPARLPLILTVSRLAPRKGHLNVLDAIKLLPFRAHWIVVGDGPCRDELVSAIADRGMEDQVSLLGNVSDEDLLACYNACDVFVLTPEERRIDTWLDSEGFGLVLHEAAACRKPVIASAFAGCKDAVIDGGTGFLVPPSDPVALSQALDQIFTDPALARRLGEGGLSLVQISGGWARFALQIFEKYEEILTKSATGPDHPDTLIPLTA